MQTGQQSVDDHKKMTDDKQIDIIKSQRKKGEGIFTPFASGLPLLSDSSSPS